jgi:hypothetical protein
MQETAAPQALFHSNTTRITTPIKPRITSNGAKTRVADSESRFLATKIFSGKFAFEAINARAGELFRSFCEI